jgi:hypothetical protein
LNTREPANSFAGKGSQGNIRISAHNHHDLNSLQLCRLL